MIIRLSLRRIQVLLIAGVAACANLGGLTGDTAEHPGGDDGPSSPPPRPAEGRVAGVDAGSREQPAEGSAFCDTVGPAEICSSFDGADPFEGWSVDTTSAQAIYQPDTNFVSSPPSSAWLGLALAPDTSPNLQIVRRSPSVLGDFELEAKVRVVYAESGPGRALVTVTTGAGALRLFHNGNVMEVVPGELSDVTKTRGSVPSLARNEWVRVKMTVRRSPSPVASVTVDDVTVSDFPLESPWPVSWVTVKLGPTAAPSPTRGWSLRYDDVVLRRI